VTGQGSEHSVDQLHAMVQKFVGRTSGEPRVATDEVNVPMLRHWCLSFADANVIYTDPDRSKASRFGGIVAPPTMLQTWTHHDRRFADAADDNAEEELAQVFAAAGYTSVVATASKLDIVRYLRPGDRTTYQGTIRSISPRKSTALGDGYFVVTDMSYTDQHGTPVGSIEFTTLRFRPRTQG